MNHILLYIYYNDNVMTVIIVMYLELPLFCTVHYRVDSTDEEKQVNGDNAL